MTIYISKHKHKQMEMDKHEEKKTCVKKKLNNL